MSPTTQIELTRENSELVALEIEGSDFIILRPSQEKLFTVRGIDRLGKEIDPGTVFWKVGIGGEIDSQGKLTVDSHAKGFFQVTAFSANAKNLSQVSSQISSLIKGSFRILLWILSQDKFIKDVTAYAFRKFFNPELLLNGVSTESDVDTNELLALLVLDELESRVIEHIIDIIIDCLDNLLAHYLKGKFSPLISSIICVVIPEINIGQKEANSLLVKIPRQEENNQTESRKISPTFLPSTNIVSRSPTSWHGLSSHLLDTLYFYDRINIITSRHVQTKEQQFAEDSTRIYIQKISQVHLLSADEEIELARKIADFCELKQMRTKLINELDREPSDLEWAEFADMTLNRFRYQLFLGQRAIDKMIQSNLQLVVSTSKKYINRGLDLDDLIQEGSLGLIRAAEKFDHEKGYKFSTYATWWIRQAITRAIADQSRTIRLPVHLYETISRIKKTTKLLSQEMGRKPAEEEIATRMEMTTENLRFIAKLAQLPISLETPIGKEENSRLGDFIEADGEMPEDQVSKSLLREDLEGVLDTLSPCERDVLRLRYGLDDGRMKTLEEIGQIFNVTRERIRQIEAKALRKLRHPNRNSILKEYLC